MRYAEHLLKTKGFGGVWPRAWQILTRFGIGSKKIARCLNSFIDLTNEFGYRPTFCVTAVLLNSYPKIIEHLNRRGAELALHGYLHLDYQDLSPEQIHVHLQKARAIFKKQGIAFSGFRFPYLSWNESSLQEFTRNDFLWSSNRVICWDTVKEGAIRKKSWANFQRVIKTLYTTCQGASHYLALPKNERGYIEIPVSLPDDEIIIDRLGITDTETIAGIWSEIFRESHQRGELFTLQSHHERVPVFYEALKSLLVHIKNLEPEVWVASLGEIAEWWQEKSTFTFRVVSHENDSYHLQAHCSPRATILVKKHHIPPVPSSLFNHYDLIHQRSFVIQCPKKPFIGIAPESPGELVNFLREEGFMVETGPHKHEYALYLDGHQCFTADHEKDLLRSIELSPFPLVRFWRWPGEARSAFAITGDIDCMTLIDFVKRAFYF